MSSDYLFLERAPATEADASADAGAAFAPEDGVAAQPAPVDADVDDDDAEPIAAGPAEGPFAEGLWWSLRWWVHQMMMVFHHPEDLKHRQLTGHQVRLIARWLCGIEGLARHLLVTAAAGLDIGKLPKLRPGKPAALKMDAQADGKRRCSFTR